jgi:hypothetical protein
MTRWRGLSYAFALVIALGLGYFIFKMPLQVSDDVTQILRAQELSFREILRSELNPRAAYLRPMMMILINFVFELAHGRYFVTFKSFHLLQLVGLLLLFVRPLRVSTAWDFCVACLAVVAVVGMHTFFGTVYEGYPINTYMTILVSCMLAVNLSVGRPAWWRDLAAPPLFVFALFTVESGVLVWVLLAVGYAVGLRGVSKKGLFACTAILLFYPFLRFVLLDGRLPGLDERSTGLGFSVRDPAQLAELLGPQHPFSPLRRGLFYLYNVATSVLTIFLAEPRAGLWRCAMAAGRAVLGRPFPIAPILYVATSTLSSLFIFIFIWKRRRAWLERRWDHDDRLVLVFLAVVVANAVTSFPYTKDVIVSPAGLMYPLALFAAIRQVPVWLRDWDRARFLRVVTPWALAAVSCGWTLRAAAVPYGLWDTAFRYQPQWRRVDRWLVEQKLKYAPAEMRLLNRLRAEALRMYVPGPQELGRWGEWSKRLIDQP